MCGIQLVFEVCPYIYHQNNVFWQKDVEEEDDGIAPWPRRDWVNIKFVGKSCRAGWEGKQGSLCHTTNTMCIYKIQNTKYIFEVQNTNIIDAAEERQGNFMTLP